MDAVGTASDTYTVPAAAGVDYLIDGKVVHAGTYQGCGTVTVNAKAQSKSLLALGATASWTGTFTDTLLGAIPRITGTAKAGYTLTANPGSSSSTPVALRYQSLEQPQPYKPTNADAGATLTVRVIASKTGYTTAGKSSARTAAVSHGSLAGAALRVTGTAKIGYTLTANPGAWSPAPLTSATSGTVPALPLPAQTPSPTSPPMRTQGSPLRSESSLQRPATPRSAKPPSRQRQWQWQKVL